MLEFSNISVLYPKIYTDIKKRKTLHLKVNWSKTKRKESDDRNETHSYRGLKVSRKISSGSIETLLKNNTRCYFSCSWV